MGGWLCDSVEAVGPGTGTVKPVKDQRQRKTKGNSGQRGDSVQRPHFTSRKEAADKVASPGGPSLCVETRKVKYVTLQR